MPTQIRPKTVKLINRILGPWFDEGIVTAQEKNEIIRQLNHLAQKGELAPTIEPRLLKKEEASEMLGISLAQFKKMERDGTLPLTRKMVGSSVRFRNTDILAWIECEQ